MKSFLLTAILAFTLVPAIADVLPVQPGKFSAPVVAQKCKDGCIVLDATDIEALQATVQKIAQDAFVQGMQEGVKKEKGTI